jgi:hypothetical protein
MRSALAKAKVREHRGPMPASPLQPGLTATFTVKGYTVHVTPDSDGVHDVTCPDLPQLSVSDGSLNGALALAEEKVGAILAGRERP